MNLNLDLRSNQTDKCHSSQVKQKLLAQWYIMHLLCITLTCLMNWHEHVNKHLHINFHISIVSMHLILMCKKIKLSLHEMHQFIVYQ